MESIKYYQAIKRSSDQAIKRSSDLNSAKKSFLLPEAHTGQTKSIIEKLNQELHQAKKHLNTRVLNGKRRGIIIEIKNQELPEYSPAHPH
jgi:hypothetical protein